MNRVLKRPMFRMGGSSGTGITSGLDRKPYQFGTKPVDFPGSQQEYDAQMRRLTQLGIFDAAGQRTGGSNVELDSAGDSVVMLYTGSTYGWVVIGGNSYTVNA